MSDADTIRSTVRIVDVLEALELPPPNSAGMVPAWLRDETKPSVRIYENADRDSWFDYGAGQGGDVIDLVKSYFGCSFHKACQWLSGMADEGMVTRRHVRTEKPIIDLGHRHFSETQPLNNEARYFIQKQWSWWASQCADRFDVRQANNALWIPHWAHLPGDEGKPVAPCIVGIKVRAYTGARFSVEGSNFRQQLYTRQVRKYKNVAVITEGEPDTWTLSQLLLTVADVYGLPSGAGVWNNDWLKQLEGYERIILCLDNDEAGHKATDRLHQELKGVARSLESFSRSLPAKDISDAVRLHGYDPVKEWGL